MKRFKRPITLAVSMVLGLSVATLAFMAANAQSCFQYSQGGFPTQATPIFNNICGIPNIGDESNFVRVRQDNGTEQDNVLNDYTTGTLTATCNSGDTFDVINYVHNDAYPQDNPDQNPTNPTAVALGETEDITATTGANTQFHFADTVSAANAATVSDQANLDCGNQVNMSVVSGSVKIFSQAFGPNDTGAWAALNDSTVNNGPTPIGSTNAGVSSDTSGTQWGCWTYVTMIVYQVKVVAVTPTPVPPVCSSIDIEYTNDLAEVDDIIDNPGSSTITGYDLNLYSGTYDVTQISNSNPTPTSTQTITSKNQLPISFTNLASGQPYTIAVTQVSTAGNTIGGCIATFTTPQTPPPTIITVSTTTPAPPPTATLTSATQTLPNTGPGDVVALFAGTAIGGTALYHWVIKRRLARN